MAQLPQRCRLQHDVPAWVGSGAVFFVTICAQRRTANTLALPSVGPRLIDAAKHYHDTGIWWLRLVVIMPDHVHAVLAVAPHKELKKTVSAWKSYQTKRLGVSWQEGFFDHRVRGDESLDQKISYVRMNPVRAGLVKTAEAWPYSWAP